MQTSTQVYASRDLGETSIGVSQRVKAKTVKVVDAKRPAADDIEVENPVPLVRPSLDRSMESHKAAGLHSVDPALQEGLSFIYIG